jgi:catalase
MAKSTDYRNLPGAGGETHQQFDIKTSKGQKRSPASPSLLSTNQGLVIGDNQNSLKAGARGPVLLEDFVLREKIFHFDHERIPERIVHARGSGAHGYFEVTHPLDDITVMSVFQKKGQRTPVFVRMSTVAGGSGSVDTPRDVRGFAIKFYAEDGNWDLVGNNIPVFFIQDAIKFPDLVHAVKMEADRGYPQAASAHDTFWDFVSLMPESAHMLMWAMSDRTLPRSLRMMEGFGVHTFELINQSGDTSFVKFIWKPVLGLQSTIWDETLKLQAADNDFHRRDLWESIDRGDFPKWTFGVQVFDQETANRLPFDVLDATKLIPEEMVPFRPVGRLVLDRNPDNFFAETEQVAFCPANIIPGIGFSNDPLLQGRLFSYLDTQKSRLGSANFHQLPVNQPRCPVHNFQRDGMMQMNIPVGRATYEPNSLIAAGEGGGPRECPAIGYKEIARRLGQGEQGGKLRTRPESFADHYSQASLYWNSLTESEQAHTATAFVFELSKVTLAHVRERTLDMLSNVSKVLAIRVAKGLGMSSPKAGIESKTNAALSDAPSLSIQKNQNHSLKGRHVGILVAEGSDAAKLRKLRKLLEKAGGRVTVIGPRGGDLPLSDGSTHRLDAVLMTNPSQLFDAVALCLTEEAATKLSSDSTAIEFVQNAFVHLKAIGTAPEAKPLLDAANVVSDDGVVGLDADFVAAACRRFWDREAKVRSLF